MVIGTLGRLAVLSTFVVGSAAKDWLGAEYKDQYLYQYPLPIPKDKTPKKYVKADLVLSIHIGC